MFKLFFEGNLRQILASGVVERSVHWPLRRIYDASMVIGAGALGLAAIVLMAMLSAPFMPGQVYESVGVLWALLLGGVVVAVAAARTFALVGLLLPLSASATSCDRAMLLVKRYEAAAAIRDNAMQSGRHLVHGDLSEMIEAAYAEDLAKGRVLEFNTPHGRRARRHVQVVATAAAIGVITIAYLMANFAGFPGFVGPAPVGLSLALMFAGVSSVVVGSWARNQLPIGRDIMECRNASRLLLADGESDPKLQVEWSENGYLTRGGLRQALVRDECPLQRQARYRDLLELPDGRAGPALSTPT